MIIRTYHMVVPKILIFSAVVSLISLMMGIVTGTLALKKKGLRLWHKMQYITKCNISRANQSFFTVEIFSIYVFHIAFSSRRLGSLVERPQIMRLSQTSFRLVSLVASHAYESFGNFVRGLCYAWMFSAEKSIIIYVYLYERCYLWIIWKEPDHFVIKILSNIVGFVVFDERAKIQLCWDFLPGLSTKSRPEFSRKKNFQNYEN